MCTHAIPLLNHFLLMCALFFDVLSHFFVFMDKQNPNSYIYIYIVCYWDMLYVPSPQEFDERH